MCTRGLAPGLILLTAIAAGAAGQEPEPTVEQQLATMRQQLAQTKLELQRSQAKLDELATFLSETDLDAKLAAWRAERQELAAERRKLKRERVRLEAVRQAVHRQTTADARERADAEQQRKQAAADALKPRWSAQYMMGLIDRDRQTIYVESTEGRVLVEQYPQIDRKQIKVRGTFLNRSSVPWRYTFEIRVAGETNVYGDRTLVGQWRYQTPLLGPGDLHPFEVAVPVTDIRYVEVIQIGKVTADRSEPAPDPAPDDDAANAPDAS
jgi:hypothetical protein